MPVSRERILAFRLGRSGLARRTTDLGAAAGEVGLPDFPPGSALSALAPRLSRPTPSALASAFEARSLVRMRAMRGAPVVVRAEDLELFADGVSPHDEKSLRAFIGPALASVDAAKMSALEAVERVADEARDALARGPLDRDALHAELRRRLPKGLLPYCRPCDSHHVHPSLLYAVALRARLLVFPQDAGPYLVARADRWLSRKAPRRRSASEAGAELVRRFLRIYGPSTVADLAAWSGTGGGQPRAAWEALSDAIVPVDVQGASPSKRWMLAADRRALDDARVPETNVRLLSPGDPLLQTRDRELLAPDPKLRKIIWANLAQRGVLLAGAALAGVVQVRKQGESLQVRIDPVGALSAKLRKAAEAEAARLAEVRGARAAKLVWS